MNESGKRIARVGSLVGATVLGWLVIAALSSSPAAAAGQRNAAPAVEQDVASARYAVADPGEERRIPGHSELTLQLD
jgi:hypothetical protein